MLGGSSAWHCGHGVHVELVANELDGGGAHAAGGGGVVIRSILIERKAP